MDGLIYLIEWLGVLLLSIEAIKIENIERLMDGIRRSRVGLNPPFSEPDESGTIWMPKALPGYDWMRRWSWWITYVVGLLVVSVVARITGSIQPLTSWVKTVLVFTEVSWYWIVLKLFLLLLLVLVLPFAMGNGLVRLLTRTSDNASGILAAIQRNTFNGVFGVSGFLLITIATILKAFAH